MALRSLTFPLGPLFTHNGHLAVGHAVACYNPGTDTLRTWYADAALTTPAANPDRTGSDGRLAQKFLGPGPAEIRQYAPVTPSSTIPNDLQDFPGAEWNLVDSWLEDGLEASGQANVYSVDTVDELRALTAAEAVDAIVAVRGYSSATDDIGVRFYVRDQYSSLVDDGGAVLNSAAGGRWLLKHSGGEVDVRVWGALTNGADVTSNIAAAASWSNANAVTLYFPDGIYTVSSGSVTLQNARFADWATFKATAGAYTLNLSGHWAIEKTGAFEDAASSYAVRVNFAATADAGTVLTAWNGADADLTRYPGQNVVLAAGSDGLSNLSGAVTLASLALGGDVSCGLANPLTIGTLVSNGYTLTNDSSSTLTIGRFDRAPGADPALDWTAAGGALTVLSDFRASDVDGQALDYLANAAIVLTVDANRTLATNAHVWPSATLQAAGGLLSADADTVSVALNGVRGDGPVFGTGWANGTFPRVTVGTWGALRAVHFDGTLGNAAFQSVAYAHRNAALDLEGKTANAAALGLSATPGVPMNTAVRNGAIVFTAPANVTGNFEADGVEFTLSDPASSGLGLEIDGPAAVTFRNCSFSGDVSAALFTATADGQATVELDGCTFYTRFRVDPSGANKTVAVVHDCAFLGGKSVWFGQGDFTVYNCEFSEVVKFVGAPGYVHFCGNRLADGANPSGNKLIDIDGVTNDQYMYRVLIEGNEPQVLLPSLENSSNYWPQTRGHFRVLGADPNDPSGPYRTGMFCGVSSNGTVIAASGCFVASCPQGYVATHHSTDPTGGVELDPNSSASPTVDIDVIFDISR